MQKRQIIKGVERLQILQSPPPDVSGTHAAPKKLILGNFHKTAKTGNIEILLSPSEILTTVCALVKLKTWFPIDCCIILFMFNFW